MSSTSSELQWPFSREVLDESITELSTSNQALSLALQTDQTNSYHQLNDKNLINRLNSASSFRHNSLNQEQKIRLIRFSIGSTSDSESNSDRIVLSLDSVPLDQNADYRALSYTWGDPNDPKNIRRVSINGEDFFITASLDAALRQLHEQSDGKDFLWVDAICINQLHNTERDHQVSMMREIYEQAKLVLIWLGPAFEDSDRVMDAFRKLGTRGTELGLDQKSLSFETGFSSWNDITSLTRSRTGFSFSTALMAEEEIIVSDDKSASLPLSPTVTLTEIEWWNRVWVLQELAVAKKAEFICGKNRLSLEHFVAALRLLTSYLQVQMERVQAGSQEQIKKTENLSYIVHRKLSRIYFFFYLRMEWERKGLWLVDLLTRTCGILKSEQNMKATDPSDRVYAILGLLSEEERLGIKVNYDASCDLVYTEIAKALLPNGARVLSFCRFPKEIDKLPSWVPDWSASTKDELYWKWDGVLDSSKTFYTSSSSVFEWSVQSENRTLKIKGRHFDNIDKVVNESVQSSLTSEYNEYQRRYNQEGSAAEELSLRNVYIAAQTYLTVLKDFTAEGKVYPSESLQDDAVWKTAIADMVLRRSDGKYTRSYDAPKEADKLRMEYKTVLNGNAYEGDATLTNRWCNRQLYQHIHEEGVIPHLVPELEDYFDNALPWKVNITKLFLDKPALVQDVEKKVLEPDFQLDPVKKEQMLAAVKYIRDSERGLMEILLPTLEYVLCERAKDHDDASVRLYLERFTPSMFLNLAGNRSVGRRAFRTSKGYIGLGPQNLQLGDHVVIVHGSTVPFILRKIEKDKFTLIGEAYVHGIMYGEGMTNETKPDDFVLC
ncbi:hypothetical protein H2198_009945 [Neophaeococcomyces mojaviensis]|uniref:Uncharacterized protein n=1 Tax=Neophaeococcomyces mojaviensis TaxID=3383035 RepID=A0ACC2ZSY0_9EURO|nr:hypothetical protein H2198_009945 [Knufia sp. JES_112]